ncbi:MAG: class I SAM-dependent methyltransferase [Phycisphaerae bacterium]|nr:class I SAM-dependent methyltransferase [Phycisphaerae bacterium]
MAELTEIELSDVAATSLVTLYCHALETQTPKPILEDAKAVEIVDKLNPLLSESPNKLRRDLAQGKLDKRLIVHIALRARRYDEYVNQFLKISPDGLVVNIGCGFDTRFFRLDNGKADFYDLDLPEVIEVKKKLLQETDRYRFIASSVLDYEWMDLLSCCKGRPFLFLAEGVFMYLHADAVKTLILKLQSHFPGSEIVCEVINSLWLNKWLKPMIDFKLQRQLHLGKGATFHFGIKNSSQIEQWGDGIEFLDDWTYLDDPEPKLGLLRIMRHFELFRKTQWTVHYRLNKKTPEPVKK